jgi:hypothetical protein
VWGGVLLPGNNPRRAALEHAYHRLLSQFETRRHIELGRAPVPALPAAPGRKRARRTARPSAISPTKTAG